MGITRKYEFGSAVLLMISRSEKNFWARKFASDIALGFWASEQTWNSLLRYSKGLSFDDTEYWWMSCDFLKIFSSLWIRLAWCKSKNVTVQRYYSLTIFKVFFLLLYRIYKFELVQEDLDTIMVPSLKRYTILNTILQIYIN